MKKIYIGLVTLTLIGLLMLSGCIQTPQQKCESKGGIWGRIGLVETPQCNLPTSDGGKICTDSNQCESACIGEDGSSTSGKCSNFKIVVGCNAWLENGQARILCVD